MTFKNLKSGFTLIELLVVISIIGLLSSVVLASLSTARAKGIDAAIKSNLAGVRSQAELYFDTHGTYGTPLGVSTTCTVANTFFAEDRVSDAIDASLNLVGSGSPRCAIGSDGRTWSLSIPLRTGGSWCVSQSLALSTQAQGGGSVEAVCAPGNGPGGETPGGGQGEQ